LLILAGCSTVREMAPFGLFEEQEAADQVGGKGLEWLRDKANQGDRVAQFRLAEAYREGDGLAADLPKCAYWYQQSAQQNYPPAQYRLGLMYGNGEGVPQDYELAAVWLRKAARQDHGESQYLVCLAYGLGRGFFYDVREAYAWCELAVRNGVGEAEDAQKTLAERMDADQISASLARAENLLEDLAAPTVDTP
jgi:TPR repeat protein